MSACLELVGVFFFFFFFLEDIPSIIFGAPDQGKKASK